MDGAATRRFWWANQNESFTEEWRHACLAAPVHDGHGRTYPHWERMHLIKPNDVVLHYYQGQLLAVSRVKGRAVAGRRPYAYRPRTLIAEDWVAPVEYSILADPIDTRRIASEWWTMAEGPFTDTGQQQHGYLYSVTPAFVAYLLQTFRLPVANP